MKDQLFVLAPGFFDGNDGPLYCSDAIAIEGLLSFFPGLRQKIDVHYIDAPRPRHAIIELLGEENQSSPVLVLSEDRVPLDNGVALQSYGQTKFINSPDQIRQYLSSQYGVARPA